MQKITSVQIRKLLSEILEHNITVSVNSDQLSLKLKALNQSMK